MERSTPTAASPCRARCSVFRAQPHAKSIASPSLGRRPEKRTRSELGSVEAHLPIGPSWETVAELGNDGMGAKPPAAQAELAGVRWNCELRAKGASATASCLDIGILEFEAGTFQAFDKVDFGSVQVHQRCLIDKDFQPIKLVNFVNRIGLGLKVHLVREARAASSHNGDA